MMQSSKRRFLRYFIFLFFWLINLFEEVFRIIKEMTELQVEHVKKVPDPFSHLP